MLRSRVIPCLLLKNRGLVKTIKFKNPTYVGDPINAIRVFNEKEVDELIFLDIEASARNKKPGLDLIDDIASECFMPFCYGGGIDSIVDIRKIFGLGAEKVSINTTAINEPSFVREAADEFGSQSIVVAMDVKETFLKKRKVYVHATRKAIPKDPVEYAVEMQKMGAGELLVNSVDRDGTMRGYDIELLKRITSAVDIPVIACGGAGTIEHLVVAIREGGASAVAAGSMFVFYGKHRAVLINYPPYEKLIGAGL